MRCLEIFINGEKVCLSGVNLENRLSADVYFLPNQENPSIFVSGDSYKNDDSWKERFIFGQQDLKIGDDILIKIIDSATPDKPLETIAVKKVKN